MNDQAVVKVAIVLVVFPVMTYTMYTVLTVVLGFVLTPLFARAGAWSEVLGKLSVGITVSIALVGSLAMSRRRWPRSNPPER